MALNRTYSIITTCKGRLEHLKQSLPTMLDQGALEVVAVDYSCPDRTGDYVAANFPTVRVVRVPGQATFSNWRARNAGAAEAQGQVLVFCDADTLLATDALQQLDAALPLRSFGFLTRQHTEQFNKTARRLGANQLRGFHVVPNAAFRRLGGYDEVLEGYAAGGDTDLEERLFMLGLKNFPLEPDIVADVIQHDDQARTRHHLDPIPVSYSAGLLYRTAKSNLLKIRRRLNFPLEFRRSLYDNALIAARKLADQDKVALNLKVFEMAAGMPLQLGFRKAGLKVTMTVEIEGQNRIEEVPEFNG
jgi:glycosyltransferase involved in cell wall biosynthesis